MNRLEGIQAAGTQKLATTASNGDPIVIIMSFNAATQEWKMDIEWNTFVLRGNRIYSSPNILCQYEAIIPFGLAVITDGVGEPFLINDFSSGRVNMYVLSPEEVEEVQDYYVSLRNAG